MSLDLSPAPASDAPNYAIDASLLPDLRFAVDLVAALQVRAFRTLYQAQAATSPDIDTGRRRAIRQALEEQAHGFARTLSLLKGTDPDGDIDPRITGLIASHAAAHGDILRTTSDLGHKAADLARAADALAQDLSADTADFCRQIMSFETTAEDVSRTVPQFCSTFWTEIEAVQNADVNHAREASETIDETLDRLARIGKHVRLVSLNASVEASRAGDAGKGLAVIAVEFKSLAEEIQTLASTARETINRLLA